MNAKPVRAPQGDMMLYSLGAIADFLKIPRRRAQYLIAHSATSGFPHFRLSDRVVCAKASEVLRWLDDRRGAGSGPRSDASLAQMPGRIPAATTR